MKENHIMALVSSNSNSNSWSRDELARAIDVKALEDKINGIDVHEFATATGRLLLKVMGDELIRMENVDDMLQLLKSCEAASGEELKANGHRLLMRLTAMAAQLILLIHVAELENVENPQTHKRTMDGASMTVSESQASFDNLGGGLKCDLTVYMLSRGRREVRLPLMAPLRFDDLVDHWVIPYRRRFSFTTDADDYARKILLSKMMLELLALDDHSVESIQEYSVSQHDWVLSSLCRVDADLHRAYENSFPKYKGHLIDAVATSLLYGCCHNGSGKINSPMEAVELLDSQRNHDNTKAFIDRARRACSFRESDCYDAKLLDFMYGAIGNSTVMVYTCPEVNEENDHSRRLMLLREWLNTDSRHSTSDSDVMYHRDPRSLVFSSLTMPSRGMVMSLPQELRNKVTRERVMEIEAKTHVISDYLMSDDLGSKIFNALEMNTGVDANEPLGPEDVYDLMVCLWNNYASRGGMNPLTAPIMLHSRDSALERLRFVMPNDGGGGLIYLSKDPTDDPVSRHQPIDDHDYTTVGTPKGITTPGSSVTEDVSDDVVRRFYSTEKAYLIHLMLRRRRRMVKDYLTDLTPLDLLVVSDMVRALGEVSNGDLRTTLSLPLEDGGCDALESVCVDACDRFHDCSNVWERKHVVLDGIRDVYSRMLDGDLTELDEAFDRLDDIMVECAVDYYTGVVLGLDDYGSVPREFALEDFGMEVDERYRAVLDEISDELD